MATDENINDDIRALGKKDYIELIYVFIGILIFIIFEFKIKHEISIEKADLTKIEVLFGFFLLGVIHILSSNILSFLYDLQTYMIPFDREPRLHVRPRAVRIIGGMFDYNFFSWNIDNYDIKIKHITSRCTGSVSAPVISALGLRNEDIK